MSFKDHDECKVTRKKHILLRSKKLSLLWAFNGWAVIIIDWTLYLIHSLSKLFSGLAQSSFSEDTGLPSHWLRN